MSISLFRTATKILLAFISRAAWQHRYYSTKVGHWRKDVLEGQAPFYLINFFLQKCLHDELYSFLLPIFVFATMWEVVFFLDGGLRARDIIFTERWKQILYFVSLLSCLVKEFPAREANSWHRKASSNPGNWVSVFFSFFSLSYRFSIFSRSNEHTHTNKEGAKTGGKTETRQKAVRFTRFLDYRLMFDSGRSFSLKYDLIRPPDSLIIPRIVASLTSRSASVLFPLAFWHLNLL